MVVDEMNMERVKNTEGEKEGLLKLGVVVPIIIPIMVVIFFCLIKSGEVRIFGKGSGAQTGRTLGETLLILIIKSTNLHL